MANAPLGSLSALEQAQLVRERRVSSEELVRHHLERIEHANPRLSAFTAVFRRRALSAARARDRAVRAGGVLGPFHGVPVGVKDLHFVRGDFTRMGSRAYQWLLSPIDDATVQAMRRAGFVIVGKTATSELALLPVVEPDTHAPTRNPWDPSRTAGGSSGGAGAAIASGMLPIAPGSDGAGSIRIPAALCGLFGHKPSRGLVPNPHATFDEHGMTTIGPLARDVEDGTALLDALVGRRHGTSQSFHALAAARPPRMTIGVLLRPPLGETEPACAVAVEEAARALERLGHRIVPLAGASAGLEEFLPIYQRLLAAIPVVFESRLQPMTRWFRAEGRRTTREEVQRLFETLTARAVEAFGEVDLTLTPTLPILPPRVGEFRDLAPPDAFRALARMGAFTAACNITGAPASTVPWSTTRGVGGAAGLPLGVQIIGRPGEDARVLSLARELEIARGGRFPAPPSA